MPSSGKLALAFQGFGILSLLFVIQDFNVGPASDLAKFSGILPQAVWMYAWLLIVLVIFGCSIKISYLRER